MWCGEILRWGSENKGERMGDYFRTEKWEMRKRNTEMSVSMREKVDDENR